MTKQELEYYINGLTHMISTTPSYINAYCLDKQKYKTEFSKKLEVPIENIKLKESKNSLKEIVTTWENPKTADTFCYWLGQKVGEIKQILQPQDNSLEEKLSGMNGGVSGFYIVEEVYFVECSNYVICICMGNNE